jgi:hypothetical protein
MKSINTMNNNGHFLTQPGLIPLADGVNWRLDGDLEFVLPTGETITVPDGFRTDLASIPPLGLLGGTAMLLAALTLAAVISFRLPAWSMSAAALILVIGYAVCAASAYLKAYGRYTYSAIVHDWLFQTHAYPFTVCNWILLLGMKSENTAWWERMLIWFNVQVFGYRIYQNDHLN